MDGAVVDRSVPWALAVSLLLHAVMVALLLSIAPVRHPEPPGEIGIAVEILTAPPPPAEPAAAPAVPAPSPVPTPAPTPVRPAPPPRVSEPPEPDPAPAMVRPSRMLSAKMLADPRSRAAARTLAQTAPEDRAIQLCSFEAMAQVAAWKPALRPDLVVAYAMGEVAFAGDTLVADGGAIRDHGAWFDLRFKCTLRPERDRVVAFEFLMGDAIPKRRWAAHGLSTDIEPLD